MLKYLYCLATGISLSQFNYYAFRGSYRNTCKLVFVLEIMNPFLSVYLTVIQVLMEFAFYSKNVIRIIASQKTIYIQRAMHSGFKVIYFYNKHNDQQNTSLRYIIFLLF